jgi:hypothetical protein
VPLYENSTRTGNEFDFLKRATRELPKLSDETVTPPILFCPVTTATCNTNMKTETKKMYRPVLWKMVIALSTTKTIYSGGFLFRALRFFEIARVLVRLDHVAHSIGATSTLKMASSSIPKGHFGIAR